MPKQLTTDQKGQIVMLRMQEMTCKAIAKQIGVHESTIYRFLKKYDEVGTVTPSPRPGKQSKISNRDIRKIILIIKRSRKISLEQLREQAGLAHVSVATLSRAIKFRTRYKSRLCPRKPFISIKNMRKRVQWCREHWGWTIEDWRRVVWSDESPFTLRCSIRERAWVGPGDESNLNCMQGTVKHDTKINVWGCFAAHKVGRLHLIEGIMNKEMYLDILQTVAKPSIEDLFPDDDYMFMQDNDPKHTSKVVQRWIRDEINTIDWWPANSPDLNPIENLWSILNRRCRHRTCNNAQSLFETLQTAWNTFTEVELTKLVDNMPKRMEAVLKAKGGPTRY